MQPIYDDELIMRDGKKMSKNKKILQDASRIGKVKQRATNRFMFGKIQKSKRAAKQSARTKYVQSVESRQEHDVLPIVLTLYANIEYACEYDDYVADLNAYFAQCQKSWLIVFGDELKKSWIDELKKSWIDGLTTNRGRT